MDATLLLCQSSIQPPVQPRCTFLFLFLILMLLPTVSSSTCNSSIPTPASSKCSTQQDSFSLQSLDQINGISEVQGFRVIKGPISHNLYFLYLLKSSKHFDLTVKLSQITQTLFGESSCYEIIISLRTFA